MKRAPFAETGAKIEILFEALAQAIEASVIFSPGKFANGLLRYPL